MKSAAIISILLILQQCHGDSDEDLVGQKYWKSGGKNELLKALKAHSSINTNPAKNVILFIGDGMGPNTITAARIFNNGETSSLFFEQFPHVGLLKTYAVDSTVPDSACTATALFSGVKTNYEVVGVDGGVALNDCETSRNTSHHLSSILAWAQDAGKSTGFVTTTRVTHATPSSLYSHSPNRKWECDGTKPVTASGCKDIARQLVENEPGKNLKVIMGGGRQLLQTNAENKTNDPLDTWSCMRKDGLDLIQVWKDDKKKRNVSWKVIQNSGDLKGLDWETDYVLGIFSNSHMPYEDQRDLSDAGSPSLADMTKGAIEVLQKNPKGFVLVIEGGMIDQAHHRGQVRRALTETVEFDKAIRLANDWTNTSETLIIVTADHAHSLTINGLTPGRNNIMGVTKPSKQDQVPFNILSYMIGGPDNFQYKSEENKIVRTDPSTLDSSKPDYYPQAGLLNDEVLHGGVDVPVYAQGPMAHLFHSVHEQSYVAHVIGYAAGIGDYKTQEINTAALLLPLPIVMILSLILQLI